MPWLRPQADSAQVRLWIWSSALLICGIFVSAFWKISGNENEGSCKMVFLREITLVFHLHTKKSAIDHNKPNPGAGFERKWRLSIRLPTLLNISPNNRIFTTVSINFSLCSLAYRLTELCTAFRGQGLNFLMTECTFVRERWNLSIYLQQQWF